MAKVILISPCETNPPLDITSFRLRMPRHGTLALASFLAAHGHQVRFFCEFVGEPIDWNQVATADYVCFSVMSFSAKRAYAMADRVKNEFDKTVIIGGNHASVLPEDALLHADYVVRNEGEATLLNLLTTLENHQDPTALPGLSFKDTAGRPVHNPDRAFMTDLSTRLNLDLLPAYRPLGTAGLLRDFVSAGMPRILLPVIQASRGCTFGCKFCFVKYEFGTQYRKRPLETVLAEVDAYINNFKTPYLFFVDNDLTYDSVYARTLFQQLLDRYGRSLRPIFFARAAFSTDDETLRIVEQFDNTTIFVGIESIQDDSLVEMNKGQNAEGVFAALERFRKYKINLQGLFIFGWDHDTARTISQTIHFCVRQRLFNIGLCALYDFPTRQSVLGHSQIIPDPFFIHRDWRFFSGNFAVHFPKQMRPSQLQRGIMEGYETFYRNAPTVYQYMPTRTTIRSYLRYLEQVEAPYYDKDDRRIDRLFENRTANDLPEDVEIAVSTHSRYLEAGRSLVFNLFRSASWKMLLSLASGKRQ